MITIDDKDTHPGILFLQDSKTLYTVALDAKTGDICGHKTGKPWPAEAQAVWDMASAVVKVQRRIRGQA